MKTNNPDQLYLKQFKSILDTPKTLWFLGIFLLNAFAIFMYTEFVLTEMMYYNTYGEKVALDRITELINFRQKTNWIAYLLIPFILLIKVGFTTICLNIGVILSDLKVGFKKLFGLSLIAELIFALANIIRVLWLIFVDEKDTLFDIQYFYPLSTINFFSPDTLQSWFAYPFITLNFFEIFYILFLALGLHWINKSAYKKNLILVLLSYGLGLLVWMIFVVFLSINLS